MLVKDLLCGSSPKPIELAHFPTRWQAFIWRNHEFVPESKMAEILHCSIQEIHDAAEELGLPSGNKISEEWLSRGYLTIIRNNWHILNYRQLLELLGWTPERMAYTLKEEDFLWSKVGKLKPDCPELRYIPLSETEKMRTRQFRDYLRRHVSAGEMEYLEAPFSFTGKFASVHRASERQEGFRMNFIYSYAASCGDLFLDPDRQDPVPEQLLQQYASMGVKGIWMHALLYRLHPIPGSEDLSAGYETRLANLNRLVARCAKYGIGLYLYLHEPRGMPDSFYDKHPDWKGVAFSSNRVHANCTSLGKPLEWLEEACYAVFHAVPGLAGAFLITMSESLTHCHSKFGKALCPRCSRRDASELIAEVICFAERGIHRAAPDASVIAYDWAWRENEKDEEFLEFQKRVIDKLPRNVWLLSVSEWNKKTKIGGIDHFIMDYSISQVGPSRAVMDEWDYARKRGIRIAAKIQVNNSWELSAVPYLPVPYLVQEHLENLRTCGVEGLMLSWTLGGYPGGNLALLHQNVEQLAAESFSPLIAPEICDVWKRFSESFREFPFGIIVIYLAPMNYGPMNLFYLKPTGYKATMIGFPYDDLDGWRNVYPEDVFESQFRKLVNGWKEGMDRLEELRPRLADSDLPAYKELYHMALASYCHFRSTLHQIQFVRLRNAGDKAGMCEVVQNELVLVRRIFELAREDSRIGFEASNHYYYTLNDLMEKMVNCEYILNELNRDIGI